MPRTAFHLRARILALLFLGVAMFGTVNVWVFRSLMLHNLGDSLATQGQTLSRLVAEESAPFLLRRDHMGLALLIDAYQKRNPEALYILIYDIQGRVTASTFSTGVPAILSAPRKHLESSRFKTEDIYFQDFSAPILGGTLGSVRVGLSESAIRSRVALGQGVILAMVFLFLLAGVGGSILIAQSVHRDAIRLSTAVGAFRLDRPIPALPVDRRDELGLVARAVEDMMQRLKDLDHEHMDLLAHFRATDRMSSVGLIASGLAHDINNPLAGLLASLERLARNPRDSERVESYLPPMIEAARHIQDVLRNLLQFVRHQPSIEGPVDLVEMVQKACFLAGHRLPKGVVITQEISPDLPLVRFNPASLLQALVNLLLNAADAMQGRMGEIRVDALRIGDHIEMTLADEGAGMAAEVLVRAFDPLFTTKGPGEGTGLGLPIARQMMRDHGGDIALESTPGVGTKVTLLFRRLEE